jgi:ADP-ribose pyrophosphatase YjhB (NUDIX family)
LEAAVAEQPRIRVAALIIHDGRVVLVRHRHRSHRYHLLPGGGVGFRETLAQALVREVAEETGLEVEVGAPVLISDLVDPAARRHVVNITFRAHITGGSITDAPADRRVEAVDLVDPEGIASLDLRPPMADAILDVLATGTAPARYLGALYTPEPASD